MNMFIKKVKCIISIHFLLIWRMASSFQGQQVKHIEQNKYRAVSMKKGFVHNRMKFRVNALEKVEIESDMRRQILQSAAIVTLWTSSLDKEAKADQPKSQEAFLRLRSIATFCIVNPDGIPFMIFDGQSSATGYFFLSFEVAAQALKDARQKDKKGSSEIWADSKIVVVPLALALQLALRKTEREVVNTKLDKIVTFNDIVPSEEGVSAAKELDGGDKGKWSQRGRVPIFHFDGLLLANGKEPHYFNRLDLLQEWKRQYPDKNPPPIQITDLVDLYRGCFAKNDFSKIERLAFMPVAETNEVALQIYKSSPEGNLPKYDFGKVFLVGSA